MATIPGASRSSPASDARWREAQGLAPSDGKAVTGPPSVPRSGLKDPPATLDPATARLIHRSVTALGVRPWRSTREALTADLASFAQGLDQVLPPASRDAPTAVVQQLAQDILTQAILKPWSAALLRGVMRQLCDRLGGAAMDPGHRQAIADMVGARAQDPSCQGVASTRRLLQAVQAEIGPAAAPVAATEAVPAQPVPTPKPVDAMQAWVDRELPDIRSASELLQRLAEFAEPPRTLAGLLALGQALRPALAQREPMPSVQPWIALCLPPALPANPQEAVQALAGLEAALAGLVPGASMAASRLLEGFLRCLQDHLASLPGAPADPLAPVMTHVSRALASGLLAAPAACTDGLGRGAVHAAQQWGRPKDPGRMPLLLRALDQAVADLAPPQHEVPSPALRAVAPAVVMDGAQSAWVESRARDLFVAAQAAAEDLEALAGPAGLSPWARMVLAATAFWHGDGLASLETRELPPWQVRSQVLWWCRRHLDRDSGPADLTGAMAAVAPRAGLPEPQARAAVQGVAQWYAELDIDEARLAPEEAAAALREAAGRVDSLRAAGALAPGAAREVVDALVDTAIDRLALSLAPADFQALRNACVEVTLSVHGPERSPAAALGLFYSQVMDHAAVRALLADPGQAPVDAQAGEQLLAVVRGEMAGLAPPAVVDDSGAPWGADEVAVLATALLGPLQQALEVVRARQGQAGSAPTL